MIDYGGTPAEVSVLLDDLVARGYLSNERFARSVVRQKANGYSRRSITYQLKAHGVDSEDIVRAVSDAGVDDEATMLALWERRFGVAPANDREKARQVRFLQARGFALTAILKLLRGRS